MQKSVSKTIQYPSQTGPYKVFVKDKGLWQSHDTARLQISVGNPKHSGDKFFALTEWAAARFSHVTLIVSDTLQRHNIALYSNMDSENAYKLSLSQGDDWLSYNHKAIENIPNKTVTRWNDWLDRPGYDDIHTLIKTLYKSNADVQNVIQGRAMEFSARHAESLTGGPVETQRIETSTRYIIEEVAAFALMFQEERAIDIYPGTWFKDIFDVLKTLPDQPELLSFNNAECLRVDFIKNKGLIAPAMNKQDRLIA